MSNMYDFNINAYEKVTGISSNLISNALSGNSSDFFNVQTASGNKSVLRKTPKFKTVFSDTKMFTPSIHRMYAVKTPGQMGVDFRDVSTVDYYSYYYNKLNTFDKKNIEFQTLQKDSNLFLTFSDDFVSYLKQNDELFVSSVTILNMGITNLKNTIAENERILTYPLGSVRTQDKDYYENIISASKTSLNVLENRVNDTNQKFKNFVGDFSQDVTKLNKPFVYEYEDGSYGFGIHATPANIGEFSSHELDSAINSIFGDVTYDGNYPTSTIGKNVNGLNVSKDDIGFVPSVNEEVYKNKIPTACCILWEMSPKEYRNQKVDYIDSEDYKKDTIAFEEYKKSDSYLSQPTRFDEVPNVNHDSYQDYLNYLPNFPDVSYQSELLSAVRSPQSYIASKIKPYIVDSLKYFLEHFNIKYELPEEGGMRLKFEYFDLDINVPQKSILEQHFEIHKIRSFY